MDKVVSEELLNSFHTLVGFSVDEFLKFYMSGYVQITSNYDLDTLKASIKHLGVDEFIRVLNETKSLQYELSKKDELLGKKFLLK